MKRNKKITFVVLLICCGIILIASALYLNSTSRDSMYYKKEFACARTTQNVMATDIFCDTDKFFNPEKFTDEEIRYYYDCSQNGSIESGCNDSEKIRQKFYKEVESLKISNLERLL